MDLDLGIVINNIKVPVLVAKPIFNAGNEVTDFQIVFYNTEFQAVVGNFITQCKNWSELSGRLSPDKSYYPHALDAVKYKRDPYLTYYSELTGNWYKINFTYLNADNLLIVTLENVTSEINSFKKLKKVLTTDNLTGLPTRASFSEVLDEEIKIARENNTSLAIITLDIDNLKTINDSMGEKEGDALIIRVSEVLKQFAKHNLSLFRYGDDEFAAIIHGFPSNDTSINFIDVIYETLQMQQLEVSAGISLYPEHSTQKDELVRFSDMAVHYAKKNGKNNFAYFEPEMQRVFIQHLTLQTKLTNAILECSFNQYYQPQYDIHTGILRGFEALIRWTDEELGEISPSIFIPLAEETGLILPIGRWVLSTAMATLKNWQDNFNFKGIMSVNVSPVQLRNEDFVIELQALINQYKINPNMLELEITEGIFINNMDSTIEILNEIKSMGIKVSLDDFGTGYSSLSYLQMMPLNTLKIDKSFINDITKEDGVQANITQSIISMVEKMGLETIAEGVENPEQLALLDKFNCTIVQGFLRGKPMPKNLCNILIEKERTN